MVKCPSCGCENSNYSIYCKDCNALLFSPEMKPDEAPSEDTLYVPVEPSVKPAAPERTSEPEPAPVASDVRRDPQEEGFKYVALEKDQEGSYTYKPNPDAAEEKHESNNDMFCIWGYVLTAVSIFTCGWFAPVSLTLSIIGLVRVSSSGKDGKAIALVGAAVSALLIAYRIYDFIM